MSTPAPADLTTTAGAVPIERDIVRVHGPDALSFLQGQLSQDIEALAIGSSAPSFLLQPTGKVEALLRVTRLAENDLVLDVDPGFGEAVFTRLKRFRLRTKADLEPARWVGYALRGPGVGPAQHATSGLEVLRLAATLYGPEAVDLLGPEATIVSPDVPVVDATALTALRIERGVPQMGAEIDEGTIPAELGQAVIDASVSFTKGCYTGQELVARIDSRGGNVPRPIRGLRLTGRVAPGDLVLLDGAEVGHVTSAVDLGPLGPVALAIVGRAVDIGAKVVVVAEGQAVEAELSGLPLR